MIRKTPLALEIYRTHQLKPNVHLKKIQNQHFIDHQAISNKEQKAIINQSIDHNNRK